MLHRTSSALTNEHIAVAQLCLRWWAAHHHTFDQASPELEAAWKALSALEATAVERRTVGHITTSLEEILWCINNIVHCHFKDAVPQFLEEVRRFFFDVVCREKGMMARLWLKCNTDEMKEESEGPV
jgi:hypothetical protein